MANTYCEYVQNKITNRKFEGYESEKDIVRSSMIQTIQFGKSTSLFIVGPQGVGKTMMVNHLLDELESNSSVQGQYQVIKLNGYLQETDELAVQHIVRELNYEEMSESEFRGTAYEYLAYVVESLRQADGSKKSLILIFDEFDIFCDNEKQLLYNLLDMVNRQSAAICVIGVARSNTCLETLHERTQSRLATISVYLYRNADVEYCLDLVRSLFTIEGKEFSGQGLKKWNKTIKEICSNNKMRELIENLLEKDSSQEFFIQFLYHVLLYINEEYLISLNAFENAYNDYHFDVLNLDYKIKNLATLDLCLVIAIYHRCKDYGTYLFNFEMIYQNYSTTAQKSGKLPQVDRLLALKAFQNLRRLGYIKLKQTGDLDATPIEYHLHELCIPKEKIKECIRNSPVISELRLWVGNSLHDR